VASRLGQASEEANQASEEGKAYGKIMRKIQVLAMALVALCAFSSVVAASASALVTLLAEWLVKGAAVGATAVPTNTEGELLFENTEKSAGFLCSGLFEGKVQENGLDEVTKVFSLPGTTETKELDEESATSGISCVSISKICETGSEIWPVNLPYETLLVLQSGEEKFFDTILENKNKLTPAYWLLCLFLGASVNELCVSKAGAFGDVSNAATDVETLEAILPKATCGGHAETGLIENNSGDVALIATTSGETLAASSEAG
jgi:hypothetical protein